MKNVCVRVGEDPHQGSGSGLGIILICTVVQGRDPVFFSQKYPDPVWASYFLLRDVRDLDPGSSLDRDPDM